MSGGHTAEADSTLKTSYPSLSIRWKRLGLWLLTSAAVCTLGVRPSRIAGTALNVESYTVCPFGNQVEIEASSAKFGKRSASIEPSGRRRSSAGNSSNTTTTTGGWRSAERAGSSSPSAQPQTSSAAASSAASQQRQRAATADLEHLHTVPPLSKGVLGNHDRIALDPFATQVEASPNCLDPAIDRDGDVALAPPPGPADPAGDLARDDPAPPPHLCEGPRQRERRTHGRDPAHAADAPADQLAMRPRRRVEARPVTRAEL